MFQGKGCLEWSDVPVATDRLQMNEDEGWMDNCELMKALVTEACNVVALWRHSNDNQNETLLIKTYSLTEHSQTLVIETSQKP